MQIRCVLLLITIVMNISSLVDAVDSIHNQDAVSSGYVTLAEYTTNDCTSTPLVQEARLQSCQQQGDFGSSRFECFPTGLVRMQIFQNNTKCRGKPDEDVVAPLFFGCSLMPVFPTAESQLRHPREKRYVKFGECTNLGAKLPDFPSPAGESAGFCTDTYSADGCKGVRLSTRCETNPERCTGTTAKFADGPMATGRAGVKINCDKKLIQLYSGSLCDYGEDTERLKEMLQPISLVAEVPFQVGKCLGVEDDDDDDEDDDAENELLHHLGGGGDGDDGDFVSTGSRIMITGCDGYRMDPRSNGKKKKAEVKRAVHNADRRMEGDEKARSEKREQAASKVVNTKHDSQNFLGQSQRRTQRRSSTLVAQYSVVIWGVAAVLVILVVLQVRKRRKRNSTLALGSPLV